LITGNAVPPPAKAPTVSQHPIEFTGSGSEYFRIWIVNLLLTIVTLTLYIPWARARKLRYFMGNTLVDGQPLGFHGNPRQMFKGYMLIGLFLIIYSTAGEFSPVAGLVALAAGVLLWPALFKSSLQFRLGNTSWRGLRFSFHGTLGGAYRAMLPVLIPAAIVVSGQHFAQNPALVPQWLMVVVGLVMLSSLLVSPWLLWNIKQYQHNHYALGNLQTSFKASVGSFYMLALKLFGMFLLLVAAPIGLLVAMMFGLITNMPSRNNASTTLLMSLVPLLLMALAFVSIKPFAISRLQNLVWTRTGNAQLRFVSTLRFRSLLWQTVKNTFLIIVTLGLYWPFAAVAMTRLRLEAVSIKTRIDPELLVADAQASASETVGDAAGDFFGLDVGL
jgi:uncharacterized membrane protein YjgN (DUF898 family)